MTETQSWKIGDVYYHGELAISGHHQDGSDLGPFRTLREARAAMRSSLGWLSESERSRAAAAIVKFHVDALDEDGSIGSAHSVGGYTVAGYPSP